MSNPIKYFGGKTYLAKQIIASMPPHKHYVEPYFGGGAVLFSKSSEGYSEVINDVDGELMNFWKVIQDPENVSVLETVLDMIPFSEEIFRDYNTADTSNMGSISRAAMFFIRYRMSRQGLGKDFATLSRTRTRRGMNEQVSSWLSAIEGLEEAHKRLQRVVILNRDAIDVIKQQDGPDTFFYLDPPYMHDTRTAKKAYKFEMNYNDHAVLLGVLMGTTGKFILSGYPSELYNNAATLDGWDRVDIQIDNKASSSSTKPTMTECLWKNY